MDPMEIIEARHSRTVRLLIFVLGALIALSGVGPLIAHMMSTTPVPQVIVGPLSLALSLL